MNSKDTQIMVLQGTSITGNPASHIPVDMWLGFAECARNIITGDGTGSQLVHYPHMHGKSEFGEVLFGRELGINPRERAPRVVICGESTSQSAWDELLRLLDGNIEVVECPNWLSEHFRELMIESGWNPDEEENCNTFGG